MVEAKEEKEEGAAPTELPADSAGLIQRRLTPVTSTLMHRTIESLNIGRLAFENKCKNSMSICRNKTKRVDRR